MSTPQLPADGDWPCQQAPLALTTAMFPRLHAFLYQLLRDGARSPGDVEAHAVQVRDTKPGVKVQYSNPHLENYADSLATYLLGYDEADEAQILELASRYKPVEGGQGSPYRCGDPKEDFSVLCDLPAGHPGKHSCGEQSWE